MEWLTRSLIVWTSTTVIVVTAPKTTTGGQFYRVANIAQTTLFGLAELDPARDLPVMDVHPAGAATDRRHKSGELRPLSEKIGKPLGFEEIVGSAAVDKIVEARQAVGAILSLSASFQVVEKGIEHAITMPEVPGYAQPGATLRFAPGPAPTGRSHLICSIRTFRRTSATPFIYPATFRIQTRSLSARNQDNDAI